MYKEHTPDDQPLTAKKRGRPVDAVIRCFVPFLNFTLVASLYAFAYEDFAPIVWLLVSSCFLLSFLLIAVGFRQRRPTAVALGFLCMAACAIGMPVGMIIGDEYMATYWRLDKGASYSGMDPSEPADSHGDAVTIKFANSTSVDVDKSLGYMRAGEVYCVAPVISPDMKTVPQTWAVGKNCCDQTGKFTCGEVLDEKASSGIVFGKKRSDWQYYRSAVRMAEATYELAPQPATIFVEWTRSIPDYKDGILVDAIALIAAASTVHLLASLCAAVVLNRAFARRQK